MKNEKTTMRDYSLVGVETKKAIEMGLADAEWYQSPVPRDKMRGLLERKDGPSIRVYFLWKHFTANVYWFGNFFGRLAHASLRTDPTCRSSGKRALPLLELPHGLYEPDKPVFILEYELSCGASHVSFSAIPCFAKITCHCKR